MIRLLLVVILFIIGGTAYAEDDTIKSESTVISNGTMDTTINSPPPSAISPQISASNSDLCTVGVAGAVQTQILGISAGRTVHEGSCCICNVPGRKNFLRNAQRGDALSTHGVGGR